ncbi:ABC transporter permease [Sulfurovum sp.]|uniref:ABC transporter permease n=1 Tax=Sulfurovum sp. TaxID=1969726 RepID=UPI0025D58E51|nr:ABC transporter permease [Sulfurovum sp.]
MQQRSSIKIFYTVEKALFLRELEMRFSSGRTGLFWTFFEPFLQILIYIAIHAAISGNSSTLSGTSNFDYTVFMASGFIAFNMFRHILSSSMGAFQANRGLFNYKQVKPIDTIVSRMLVELFLTGIIVLVFLFIGFVFHFDNTFPKDPAMVCLGYLWLVLFSFAVGLVVAIGNTFFMSFGKFIGLLTFGLLLLSAIFYPLVHLPPAARDALLYNPLVHFMEMIHGYYMYGLDTRFVDYRYMLLWTVVPLFIGFWLYHRLEKRIISP